MQNTCKHHQTPCFPIFFVRPCSSFLTRSKSVATLRQARLEEQRSACLELQRQVEAAHERKAQLIIRHSPSAWSGLLKFLWLHQLVALFATARAVPWKSFPHEHSTKLVNFKLPFVDELRMVGLFAGSLRRGP